MTSYASCPTAVVNAPVEVIWELLTEPIGWGTFYDIRVLSVDPPGKATVGQRCRGESGPSLLRLKVSFEFTRIDPKEHHLGVRVQLPFGIRVQEEMDCRPLGEKQCRVNYHCNFDLPTGWKGWAVRKLLGRELDKGPQDSIDRLKRAAETRAASSGAALQKLPSIY
ncbi:MAG: SRPBCC family protein [Myxococcales bacterium]